MPMSKLKKLSYLIIPVSFIIGLWWGFKLLHEKQVESKPVVRMLAYQGLISEDMKAMVYDHLSIELTVVEVDSTNAWLEVYEKESFDLLAPMSFEVEALIGQGRLMKVPGLAARKRDLV